MPDPIGTPFVAVSDGNRLSEAASLARMPLDSGISEGQIQDLLAEEPGLLPLHDIDERVDIPLICIGKEIHLATGPVDILFISQNGYLVAVETKLWRNPESRRKVVAQILDYAGQLRQWDYSKLQEEWQRQQGKKTDLYTHVHPDDYEEAEWIDLINENLAKGRMTLLVVGDGIRSETRQLADAVSGHPEFQFRLGLIELRLYQLDVGKVLAIPTTLAKTQEIERAVVRVDSAGKVTVETPSPERVKKGSFLDEEAFIAEVDKLAPAKEREGCKAVVRNLLRLLPEELYIGWRQSSFIIRYKNPFLSSRFSLALVLPQGQFGFWKSPFRNQLKKAFHDEKVVGRVFSAHVRRMESLGLKSSGKEMMTIPLAHLAGKEADLIQAAQETVQDLLREADKMPGKDEE